MVAEAGVGPVTYEITRARPLSSDETCPKRPLSSLRQDARRGSRLTKGVKKGARGPGQGFRSHTPRRETGDYSTSMECFFIPARSVMVVTYASGPYIPGSNPSEWIIYELGNIKGQMCATYWALTLYGSRGWSRATSLCSSPTTVGVMHSSPFSGDLRSG